MRKQRHPVADRNGRGAGQHLAPEDDAATDATSDGAVDVDADGPVEQQKSPEAEGFPQLLRQFRELGEYFSYYLAARADSAKVGLRNALVSVTLAALAFIVVASLSLGAIWFALNGAAEGLSILCGNRPWAGNLLTGSLLVAALAAGMCVVIRRLNNTTREGTVAKYENRKFRQQARYGHNVADRAAEYDPAPHRSTANGSKQK